VLRYDTTKRFIGVRYVDACDSRLGFLPLADPVAAYISERLEDIPLISEPHDYVSIVLLSLIYEDALDTKEVTPKRKTR
jgi:hypothetical protein